MTTWRVSKLEQRGDGELAEHQRHREERGGDRGAADVRDDDAPDHAGQERRGCGAASASVDEVDRRQAGVEGPVGERQHEDDVDEGQRQRRVAEEVGDPAVDRGEADDEHDRRDGQRQQADELDHAAQRGRRSWTQTIVGTSSTSIRHTVSAASSSDSVDGVDEVGVGADREPGVEAPLAADARGSRTRASRRAAAAGRRRPGRAARRTADARSPAPAQRLLSAAIATVRVCRMRVERHDDAPRSRHAQRQRLAEVGLAEHDLAGQEGADLQRHQRAAPADQRLGGGVGREGVGEQQQRRAEEATATGSGKPTRRQ